MTTLYHYCSTDAFVEIITKGTIRLSSLSLANDSLEGRMVSKALMELGRRDSMDDSTLETLEQRIGLLEEFVEGLGFCLSAKEDMLSQWRGYADDGKGVAIGFDQHKLMDFVFQINQENGEFFTLTEVVYELEDQMDVVRPAYLKLKDAIDNGGLKNTPGIASTILGGKTEFEIEMEKLRIEEANRAFYRDTGKLFPSIFRLKSKAFKEEVEWRIVSIMQRANLEKCKFRSRGNKVIPYLDIPLSSAPDRTINEIWLGPKNCTPQEVIKSLVRGAKLGDVEVHKSFASYV